MRINLSVASTRLYYVALIAICLEFCAMYQVTPFISDDLWYLHDTTGEPGSMEYLRTTFESCVAHLSNVSILTRSKTFKEWNNAL